MTHAYRRYSTSYLLIILWFALASCAAPKAPKIRTSASDNEGPIIPGCQNISPSFRPVDVIEKFYLSTWSSAVIEGALAGAKRKPGIPSHSAIFGNTIVETTQKAERLGKYRLINLLKGPQPFCRQFNASAKRITQIIKPILLRLGEPKSRSLPQGRIFHTEFKQREHSAASWIDAYFVAIVEEAPEKSNIYVYRPLYISRDSGYSYGQGISVGYNESWILARIGDGLVKLE